MLSPCLPAPTCFKPGEKIPLDENKNLSIIDIGFSKQFVPQYIELRKKKEPGLSTGEAENKLHDPMTFACMLLKNGFADIQKALQPRRTWPCGFTLTYCLLPGG